MELLGTLWRARTWRNSHFISGSASIFQHQVAPSSRLSSLWRHKIQFQWHDMFYKYHSKWNSTNRGGRRWPIPAIWSMSRWDKCVFSFFLSEVCLRLWLFLVDYEPWPFHCFDHCSKSCNVGSCEIRRRCQLQDEVYRYVSDEECSHLGPISKVSACNMLPCDTGKIWNIVQLKLCI